MSNDFQAGSRLGEYVLDSYIGGGSFGAVWRGHDSRNGQVVAIKLLTGALASSEAAATRADVEVLAAAAARRSPHVVQVLDGGMEPLPYIVMEFVEGKDLLTILKEQGALGIGRTIDVGLAISDALQALFLAGIVHRDIKPANVMEDKSGVIKLADFGIAKIVGYETITMAGQAAMTMAYAAPEIWDEGGSFGRPSHRSDLYAMGILLYQCLTGLTPFRGNYGTLYKAHTEEPPDLKALPAGTPPSLRNLIGRCLQKRQEDRPQDAAECRTILRRAEAELASTTGVDTVSEPKKLGPWIKDAPHESVPWAWRCHHESTGQRATVEVHFAEKLAYGETLRKAVAANPQLRNFGAERLLETNRLLLRPTESWWEPPPGEFQFWVAREDLELVVQQTSGISESRLRRGVESLTGLMRQAEAAGIRPDLRSENLTLLDNGTVYVRRPGLIQPEEEPAAAAFAFLRGLPLDATARALVTASSGLTDLAASLAQPDSATMIASQATQIGRPPTQDAQVTVVRPPVLPEPQAPLQASPPRVARPHPAVQELPPPGKQKPLILIGAGVGAVALVAVLLFLAFGNGSGKDDTKALLVSKAESTPVGGAVVPGTPAAVVANSTATVPAGKPQGPERLVTTILVETTDSDCADGKGGCRLVYSVGPFRFRDNTLRIEYVVQIVVPRPGTGIEWIDDLTFTAQQKAKGEHGTQLTGESGKTWPLVGAGGIAGRSDPALPPGRYAGSWDFVFEEAAGSKLSLDYPDFDDYITVVVPP